MPGEKGRQVVIACWSVLAAVLWAAERQNNANSNSWVLQATHTHLI